MHNQPGISISFDIAIDAKIETIEEDKYCNENEEVSGSGADALVGSLEILMILRCIPFLPTGA